ncbi:hypothetical protein IMZ29_00800 [Achromobacter sp. GG226]|uniref:hypothetical protein n=1 Tax=Verticiella alkaliphila TaxID=2779529 RepID=UPI001C0C64A3|nr:hypothetical protein [Verticiella sp. GG226]MBU4609141.1 hypothetical protein [Verticiella sp. GG226]
MEYTIKNTTKLGRAFPVKGGGLQIVKPGETATLTMRGPMPDARLAALKGDGIEVTANKQPEPAQGSTPVDTPAAPAPVTPAVPADDDVDVDIDALRAEYRELAGEDADKRWKAGTLRTKIEELMKA